VRWYDDDRANPTRAGSESEANGYVLFRYVDLAAVSLSLKQGDRIVKMGTINTDVYITSLRPEGHYPDQSGPALVKAFFRDRNPSKQTPGGM